MAECGSREISREGSQGRIDPESEIAPDGRKQTAALQYVFYKRVLQSAV